MRKLPVPRCVEIVPALVLALVFVFSAWERFHLPMTPYTNGDVWAYLLPGLRKLLEGKFQHVFGQCFLYPGFLYVILRVAGDFRGITVVQNLLGLGTGALLFGCWMQLRCFLPAPRLPAVAFKLVGAALVGVYLFSTATMGYERVLRPEAIFPFFATLNIYCNLRFIRARFLDRQRRWSLLSGGAALFVSVVAWLLKPSFSAALVFANLPVLIFLFWAGESAGNKAVFVGVPAVAALVLLVFPEWKLRQEDRWGAMYLARSLFSIHADIIDEQISEDVARRASTPYSLEFLTAAHEDLSKALRDSRDEKTNYFPVLGFNADDLLKGKQSCLARIVERLDSGETATAFYRYYYWRSVLRHPTKMAVKIARQFGIFYRFGTCPAYSAPPLVELGGDYGLSASLLGKSKILPRYEPGAELLARTEALKASALQIGPYPFAARVSRLLGASYLGLCLGTILLGFGAWKIPVLQRAFGASAPVLLLLYSYNFGTVLTLAVSHSLDITRYSQYQLAYTLLPEFGAGWLALELLAVTLPGLGRQTVLGGWWTRLFVNQRWMAVFGWRGRTEPGSWLAETFVDRWRNPLFPPRKDASTPSLPRLVPKDGPPTLAIVILAGSRTGEQYKVTFPDACIVSSAGSIGGILDALGRIESDLLLLIDADAQPPVDAAWNLHKEYLDEPADLLIGSDSSDQRKTTRLAAFVLRITFGWTPRRPLSGTWLCSRRFYRNLPLFALHSARALQLETTVNALENGFVVREAIPNFVSDSDATDHNPVRPHFADDVRIVGGLLASCIRARPFRSLWLAGTAMLLLGFALAYSPLVHAHETNRHVHPGRILISASLFIGGLLSLHAGLILNVNQHYRHGALQMRLRRGRGSQE